MTKNEFVATAKPVTIAVAGVPLSCPPRRFGADKPPTEQSVGYNYNSKVALPAGAKAVDVTVGGFTLAAAPTKKNPDNFYGTGKVTVDGQTFQVGANITKLPKGNYQVGVNAVAVNSKAWEEGVAGATPQAAAAASAQLTAPAVPAPAPTTEESVTFLEAKKRAAAALKMPFEKVTDRMVNRFANGQNLTIAG